MDRLNARAAAVSHARTSGLRLLDDQGTLALVLDVTGLDGDAATALEGAVRAAMLAESGISELRIAMTRARQALAIIAVGSGKGGVGKSTLSTNIAIALKRQGRKVGLVDADIHGPSQPRLMGIEGQQPEARGSKLVPVTGPHGVPLLSTGQIAAPGQAIAWRGPMAGRALEQLIDAHWGDTELLIVDLPPGTGDVQLSMISKHKPLGAVIVSTPQDLALMDATRAVGLFEQAEVPIIGMVENMAGYLCPHCGEFSDPFGSGGAEAAAGVMGLDFLGRVPLDIGIRTASDEGQPPAAHDGALAQPFLIIASRIGAWLDARKGDS
ncbi:MAG: P-loop NTPase [Sphingopyxis sp.]|nr:P-loop NTPase [Sphingopyxis sp.]